MGKLADLEKKLKREGLSKKDQQLYEFLKKQKQEREGILQKEPKMKIADSSGFFEGIKKYFNEKMVEKEPEKVENKEKTKTEKVEKVEKKEIETKEKIVEKPTLSDDSKDKTKDELMVTVLKGMADQLEKSKKEEESEKTKLHEVEDRWNKLKELPFIGNAIGRAGSKAVGRVMGPVEAAVWAFIFGISLFVLAKYTVDNFLPMIEGYSGTPLVPSAYNIYIKPILAKGWYTFPVVVLVLSLPFAFVGAWSGMNFKGPNKMLWVIIAFEFVLIFSMNSLIPWLGRQYPEQYNFGMCMIKYGGNMEVCALGQTEEVDVDKEGSGGGLYETLSIEMGAVSPSKKVLPMPPNPVRIDKDRPYFFPFTLKNNNQEGSQYYIEVIEKVYDGINVTATDETNSVTALSSSASGNELINYPNVPIKPGGYYIVSARFEDFEDITCTDYTYFIIEVTTEQQGGGSTEFGIIETNEGLDNQNFMYFFDPDVRTEPGPLDIYTYTIPFVLPKNETDEFQINIKIENKGTGIGTIDNLEFHFNPKVFASDPVENCYAYCTEGIISCPKSISYTPLLTIDEGIIKFNNLDLVIPQEEEFSIICNALLKSGEDFFGKTTELISVTTEYKYKQTVEEQMACVMHRMPSGYMCANPGDNLCVGEPCCCLCPDQAVSEGFTQPPVPELGSSAGCNDAVCPNPLDPAILDPEGCYCN